MAAQTGMAEVGHEAVGTVWGFLTVLSLLSTVNYVFGLPAVYLMHFLSKRQKHIAPRRFTVVPAVALALLQCLLMLTSTSASLYLSLLIVPIIILKYRVA